LRAKHDWPGKVSADELLQQMQAAASERGQQQAQAGVHRPRYVLQRPHSVAGYPITLDGLYSDGLREKVKALIDMAGQKVVSREELQQKLHAAVVEWAREAGVSAGPPASGAS
jgi:hypothetical protein